MRSVSLALVVVAGFLTVPVLARAGMITLDVSATTVHFQGPGACSPTCTLGGDIVINNSPPAPGMVISADVTATGFSPSVGPFTTNPVISDFAGFETMLKIDDAAGDVLTIVFATPTAGSLVGYTGGSLDPLFGDSQLGNPTTHSFYSPVSGSLTPVPEPASLAIFGTALAGLGLMRRRRRRHV